MTFQTKTIGGYECARCGEFTEADGPFDADKPSGYFITVERVTSAKKHYVTGEVYLCDKECLINFMQYSISSSSTEWRPIGS